MAQIDQLHERLLGVAALLDEAAAEIRDLPLAPETDNIRHVGKALSEIFEILRSIYAVRPDPTPPQLLDVAHQSEANKRLTRALSEAYRLSAANRVPEAVSLLSSYAESEQSELHRTIALHEMRRLKEKAAP